MCHQLPSTDPILIQGEVPTFDGLEFCHEHMDISDDGYARGVFTHCALSGQNCGAMKVTIDATQDCYSKPVLGCGGDAILFSNLPLLQCSYVVDGVRRFSYINRNLDHDHLNLLTHSSATNFPMFWSSNNRLTHRTSAAPHAVQ